MALRDIDIATVMIAVSVLIAFPIQLLLCFKVKNLFLTYLMLQIVIQHYVLVD